jgi:hypothetical protein
MPLKIKHVGFADLKRLVENEVAASESFNLFPLLCLDGVDISRQQAMRSAIKGVMVHDPSSLSSLLPGSVFSFSWSGRFFKEVREGNYGEDATFLDFT